MITFLLLYNWFLISFSSNEYLFSQKSFNLIKRVFKLNVSSNNAGCLTNGSILLSIDIIDKSNKSSLNVNTK